MSLATAEAIRDRIQTLVEALAPASLTRDTFRRYRNEGGADFRVWAETGPVGVFRRFQVREVLSDESPDVTYFTQETVRTTLELIGAYPQNQRYGAAAALDRDDVIRQDWKLLKYNLCGTGGAARGNFSGAYDCTPLPATMTIERGGKVDFLVVTLRVEYTRATT